MSWKCRRECFGVRRLMRRRLSNGTGTTELFALPDGINGVWCGLRLNLRICQVSGGRQVTARQGNSCLEPNSAPLLLSASIVVILRALLVWSKAQGGKDVHKCNFVDKFA